VTSHDPHPSALPLRVYLIVSATVAMTAAITAWTRRPTRREAPPPPASAPRFSSSPRPIAAEAEVFRTSPRILALEPGALRQRSAHPRTMVNFRFLRAFPGAPPRIPHGLTPDEFRTTACTACHERGGYSIRFTAYAPITPHPELGDCLQCHVGEDVVMGVGTAMTDPNTRCPVCHAPTGRLRNEVRLTWPRSRWVTFDRGRAGSPPPIPHDRAMRGNCVACHAGPAAVAEIRTLHPERASCRQCHVEVESAP
jgi:cytochrome c-type protein NapB